MKANKTRNELKASDSNTYQLKIEERRRTMKNLHEITHGNVSEALQRHLGLDFLHENMFFNPKQLKCIA